jgi:hypothetical protein
MSKSKLKVDYIKIFIFISFFLSIILTSYYLKNYDNYTGDYGIAHSDGDEFRHQMIKTDSYRYLSHGAEIKKDLEDGKNFFETGRIHFTKYLPARLAAAYYIFFDVNLFNNFEEKKINLGVHFPYLLIQSLLYYLSVFFLYIIISKKIEKNICLPIIVFLCLEPTIVQYHGTFWSESLFFTLQIVVLTLILRDRFNSYNFFLIGLFISLLSLQRQTAYFFIIPILFYYLILMKKNDYYKLIFLVLGFFLIQSFVGYNNLVRDNKFYFLSGDAKTAVYFKLARQIMIRNNSLTHQEFLDIESKIALNWLQKNSIKFDLNKLDHTIEAAKFPFKSYRTSIINESDAVLFDNFYAAETVEILLNNPWAALKIISYNSIHSVLLNPFHIYSDHNFVSGEDYYFSEKHDKLVLVRVIYTILIYAVSLIGFFTLVREKKYHLLFILLISILYTYGMISWHGNTRYFVPVVIYLSFFFGFGYNKLILSLKK